MSQEMHVDLGRGALANAPRHFFDHDPALSAIDAAHVIYQKDQIAPEADELEPPRRARLVVAGRGLMTTRTNGRGSFPRPYRDEDGLPAFGEASSPVDKSWDGMALVQNSGKAHAWSEIDTKMKTNPDSLPSTPAALLPYCRDCRDLGEWPERWMGEEKDLSLGRRLVECFMPFLLHLTESGLSKRTIQNHVDNIWLLGGEIIRDVNEDPSLRKIPA